MGYYLWGHVTSVAGIGIYQHENCEVQYSTVAFLEPDYEKE